MLSGFIASLGTRYIITLTAANCQSGDSLAQQQAEASSKEQVQSTLGSAVSKLRGTLGESLASVQKFDVPIEQVSTASLDALKAFALGNAEFDHGREMAALRFIVEPSNSIRTSPGSTHAWVRFATTRANRKREKNTSARPTN
jgi:eukaryotic-like serine/threonine-protein kinase